VTHRSNINRRQFVVSAAAVGGGMALGFHLPSGPDRARADGDPEINAWIVIRRDDTVVIRVAPAEMGQGIFTALPMLVAEELECDWEKVKPEFVSATDNIRRNHVWGDVSTGASRSVGASQEKLRRAGATAREMLIAAAAARWKVPAAECRTANGVITHGPSRRTVRFGAVAEAAAQLPPPANVTLKDPKDWKLIGTRKRGLDVPDKVSGKAVYGIDVRLPGMLYAAIVQCPVFKGTLRSVDKDKAVAMKGVRHVVEQPDFVAVVADSWWRAKQAVDALAVSWDDGDNGHVSSASIQQTLREGLDAPDGLPAHSQGDATGAMTRAAKRIEAEYAVPFLAHATMEPQNCTAHVVDDRVELWLPTQDAETALSIAADAAGVPQGNVVVHRTMLGGGFGRRGSFQDYVRQAVLIAKDVDRPVQLLWSREQDIQHDVYRPTVMARMTAGFDTQGMPLAWSIRISGQSITAQLAPEFMSMVFDRNMGKGLLPELPYAVPNYFVDGVIRNSHVPIGPWRALDYSQNCFFRESFIDEMAHTTEQDPYLFRRKLLAAHPKYVAVLDAAAAKAGWNSPAPSGVFRGIAFNRASGSFCAQVVEVSVSPKGALKVHRVVAAIDPGTAVNPSTIEAQTEGAIVYALTAALHGEISIKDGRVEQSNFHDYEMLRLAEMPVVQTVIVPSGGFWGGVGEMALSPLAPALCNAIFAATGKRIRTLPLKNQTLI
jgi:isoquinoline 1-oxidoreductase beta subunit